MTAEIRKRHIAHAITLTQHVLEILTEIKPQANNTTPSASSWNTAEESIDMTALLLRKLTTLYQESHWIDNV